jgi:hypothetical protein
MHIYLYVYFLYIHTYLYICIYTYIGMEFTEQERAAVDWAPPTAFGMDNSVRLLDANEGNGDTRVMTSMQDIKEAKRLELQEKIRRANGGDDDEEVSIYEDYAYMKIMYTHICDIMYM